MSTRNPQRKRRGGAVNSRQTQKRTRETTSTPEISLEAEPIELVETVGDEIVDLTCESLEPVVVDLTHNDSVVVSIWKGEGQGEMGGGCAKTMLTAVW
ncbi:E3 ubiquitin-protein ligase RNF4 isoform X1 [Rattus norvegicus]|uniref:E3 ubiquitin-protein ligase RNF4 isoform X1 n=1 Tax=Rattus norvegicus TaxID=10116 RepID=UPI002FD7F1FB